MNASCWRLEIAVGVAEPEVRKAVQALLERHNYQFRAD